MRHPLLSAALILAAGTAQAQDLLFPPGEDPRFDWASFEAFKSDHDLTGQSVTIAGPWTAEDEVTFRRVFEYFEAATGATVNYAGSDSFEQQIVIDTSAGSPPDIAVFPQPGLARGLAAQGKLAPLPADTGDWLRENYAAGDSWVELVTFPGSDGQSHVYGFPYKIDVKSLVFYSPENFAALGYEVPRTMEDLKALTERIAADGGTPWCIGLGAGATTGWPATDWVEDMMLRIHPPEVYDQWVTHQIPFDDPRVVEAIDEFGWFAKTDAFVDGGAGGVGWIDHRDSPTGLFSIPPRCFLMHQASFIGSFFPPGTEFGTDVDFFYMPPYASRPELGSPVLGAGTTFSLTRDTPVAQAFLEFLRTPLAHEVWMAQTGFLTPLKTANLDAYGDPTLRGMGEILVNADTFRFDASDLMPGAIGAAAFWTGMIDYVAGDTAAEAAGMIEQTWESLARTGGVDG
ncbi:ABC transporter substrate-binding protein [Falsirhodobacter sp. 20TX0035]|uniref:ABC transporter substrate-binding protein n=1 Tax=Falsirhodobacter sp. 20TX0035 TaxID=3022019 RepID=UPI00232CD28C|nr:ABC transporter substrate-binding protein [Falsirhodobacter sp. 20TX0035]MDB6452587.1 ABC transporter substrate-binding protein [Falsirhodobacter sp. 20TX0035]